MREILTYFGMIEVADDLYCNVCLCEWIWDDMGVIYQLGMQ